MSKNIKVTKASPNKKRLIQATLAGFQHFNFHVDLIAYCYEVITEEKEEDIDLEDFELLGDEIYKLTESIEAQLGIEKYVEVLLFIRKLKEKYVTDLREKTYNIATEKTLVFFGEEESEKVISYHFDAVLIYKEMEKFIVNPKKLKKIAAKLQEERGERDIEN